MVKFIRKRLFLSLFVFLFLQRLWAFEVSLSTDTVYPGDTLAVWVTGISSRSRMSCSLLGRHYPLYPLQNEKMRTLIGIPLGINAQETDLKVRKKIFLFYQKRRKRVTIEKKDFSIQILKMPPKKQRLLGRPRNRKEREEIKEVLCRETREQYWKGIFGWPVQSRISGSFGLRRRLSDGRPWGRHLGIDIAADEGTPVYAPNAGEVLLCREFTLHGKTVILDHGQGVMSIFLHLEKFKTREGARVQKGEVIGTVGSSGFASASHLHWGLYIHGIPVDPLVWTRKKFD